MKNKLSGITLSLIIAIPSWFIGQTIPVIGGPVVGILLGMIMAFWKRPSIFKEGIDYTSKKLLQYSIILIGFDMNLFNVFRVGKQTLILMVFTLSITFVTAYLAGKLLKIDGNTKILIGVGSAICGGSAIAATAPIIDAKEEEIAHSISTIFLFNVIAAFLFPILGHLLFMSDQTFGIWAGTAINDTSSVVAAGYSYSNAAGNLAVIVKLTRTLMIVPITLFLAFYTSRKNTRSAKKDYSLISIFPWFVLGFIFTALLNTFIPFPEGMGSSLAQLGKFMIVMAMAAIGIKTNIVRLIKNGGKPILLGLICWIVLAITSILVQYFIL